MIASWTLDDIAWNRFDPKKVTPELLALAKAAALVEYNGGDYARYLKQVFLGDAEFCAAADQWAREEIQHGSALARWAKLADPAFDFEAAFRKFTDYYKLPVEARRSVRGSRAGELVARCIVETGTSSYYAALSEAGEEPVFKEICRHIASDELRHYKLFYSYLRRYLATDKIGKWRRVLIAARRLVESEDDELSYAYYAANHPGQSFDRKHFVAVYSRKAYSVYRRHHVERGIAMILKAIGWSPYGTLQSWLTRVAWKFMTWRISRPVSSL